MRIRNYIACIASGAVISLICAFALYRAALPFGAASLPEQLADIQKAKPGSIVMPFDIRYNLAFKIRRLEADRPDIVWFGTSRVGSAMAQMFAPHSFYNMGFTAWTNEQLLEAFERSTRTVRPRIAILSLDFFLFSDRWESQLRTSRQMILDEPLRYLKSSVGHFVRTAWSHWDQLSACRTGACDFVGPQTVLSREGFRLDGSWRFSQEHIEHARAAYRNADFLAGSLAGDQRMSERQKRFIATLAGLAKVRGIQLIAVQLPYLRAGVSFLESRSENDQFFGVWHDFESDQTAAWLRSLGLEFVDLSHSSVDDNADNFIDAYHLSEPGMQAAVAELRANPDVRRILESHLATALPR